MENHEETKTYPDFSILYTLAAITGAATAWVVANNLVWVLVGAVLGLLTAGFFINVVIKKGEDA